LRIRFAGKENLSYSHVSQVAVVKPGVHLFIAQVRTEGITTEQLVEVHAAKAWRSSPVNRIRLLNFFVYPCNTHVRALHGRECIGFGVQPKAER